MKCKLSYLLVLGGTLLLTGAWTRDHETESTIGKHVADTVTQSEQASTPTSEKVFEAVEQPAEFPGGQEGLMKWLGTNIRYPESAIMNGIQGRVIVKFIVEKDGTISNATVVKGVDRDLDQEALRVVRKMPKWNPARNNSKVVRSYFTLPVSFKFVTEPTEPAE